jgi:ubiquinone/menaquinone biosynthesis C-methylase UbiE
MKTLEIARGTVQEHFTARAATYDGSSFWCTDDAILERIRGLLVPNAESELLDVAVGTGLVSRHLAPHVGRIVGLDINRAMVEQARDAVDELVISPAETMPFDDDSFDLIVCRQGIQFMELEAALAEFVRVLKPGGRMLSIDLAAYGPDDRDEYFEILRLRNPARRNFFVRGDVRAAFLKAGCAEATAHEHVSIEDVDVWSDNGAIPESRREGIRGIYRAASPAFAQLHSVALDDGRIVDHMLFELTVGTKG